MWNLPIQIKRSARVFCSALIAISVSGAGIIGNISFASACEKHHMQSAKAPEAIKATKGKLPELKSGQNSKLKIAKAWSPETPPHMKNGAVYLNLANLSDKKADIVSVLSDHYSMAYIHRSAVKDGISTMQAIEQLSVPGGETALFKPGGLHIMLMGAKQSHKAGDTIPLTFKLSDGSQIKFEAKVVKAGAHDHSHMKHNS